MKPPVCALCGRRFPSSEGRLVKFSNYQPLPERMMGHPVGAVWFCERHVGVAERLSGRTSTAALAAMNLRHPFGALLRLLRSGRPPN